MRRAIHQCVQLAAAVFEPQGPILEIGSYYGVGHEKLSDFRGYFPGRKYTGCDIRPGHGVDCIEDAHALSFSDESAGTLMLLEILEHLRDPDKALSEAHRVLRSDGLLMVSVPFQYRLHGFPSDYWRFTASGLNEVLSGFADRLVFAVDPRLKPAFVFAVAAKTARADFMAKKGRFRVAIEETFKRSRLRGAVSVFKERSRDFVGFLLGRAQPQVCFFDPGQTNPYESPRAAPQEARHPHGSQRKLPE